MIERTHPRLSVGAQCRLLSISRSSFYCEPQGETRMNLDLMLLIDNLNRPGFTGGQSSRRIARYGTETEEEREAVFP